MMQLRILALALLLTACAGPRPCPPCTEITQRTFPVLRVIDGDTLVVPYDGEPTSVRLWGIDTPERGEPGAAEATAALSSRVVGRTIRIEFPGPKKRDNFGRLLCVIYVDGENINELMADKEQHEKDD